MSHEPRKYDSTVARMAGNIAAGLAPNYAEDYQQIDVATLAETCVQIARAIVAEVKRTEPAAVETPEKTNINGVAPSADKPR